MAKLKPRYTPAEKAALLMCIKPVEHYRLASSLTYNPAPSRRGAPAAGV